MTAEALPVQRTMSVPRTVLVLGAMSAFGPLSMDLYLPSLPELATSLGTSDALAQLTMIACTVGLGLGGIFAGPLSDRHGRRPVMLIGVIGFTLLTLCCVIAPDIWSLIAFRFVQGLLGAASMVVARAAVRDMFEARDLSRIFSLLMLVTGTAPIIAPVIGGQLVRFTDWRGVFVVLAVIGALLVLVALLGFRETLSPEMRTRTVRAAFGGGVMLLLRDRTYVGMVLMLGFTQGAFMTYLAMSSFVFEHEYALTATGFSLLFAVNSVAIIAGAQLNALLTRWLSPQTLLTWGLLGSVAALLIAVVLALTGGGFWELCVPLFITLLFQGWVMPNSSSLALEHHAANAGLAAALLGSAQFIIGPVLSPVVSSFEVSSRSLSITMCAAVAVAVLVLVTIPRRHPDRIPAVDQAI